MIIVMNTRMEIDDMQKFVDAVTENKVVNIIFDYDSDEGLYCIDYNENSIDCDPDEIIENDIIECEPDEIIENNIFGILSTNCSVKKLSISSIIDPNICDELFECIAVNRSIEFLSLRKLCIKTRHANIISEMVKNGNIKILNISYCEITDHPFAFVSEIEDAILCPEAVVFNIIADAVASSTSVVQFSVGGCDLNKDNVKYLADVIADRNNQTLKYLSIFIYTSYFEKNFEEADKYVAERLVDNYSITYLQVFSEQPNCNKLVERNTNFQVKRLKTTKKAI